VRSFLQFSYYKRAQRLARLQQGKPVSALTSAVSWVELLAQEQDLSMLRPHSTQISLLTYSNVDVYAVLVTAFVLIIYILFAVIRFICRCICCRKRVAGKNKRD
jgi:hypothetical protein